MKKDFRNRVSPQAVEMNLTSLCGMLEGMLADNKINSQEVAKLIEWFEMNKNLNGLHPFSEIQSSLNIFLADGLLSAEELKDLLWICRQHRKDGIAFDDITKSIQFLHGLVSGLGADGLINAKEIDVLKKWCLDHEYLKGCWPYDEFLALSIEVIQDGKITSHEHDIISYYFNEFMGLNGNKSLRIPLNEATVAITGVCAVCPEIEFDSKNFVLTGESSKLKRKDLIKLIEDCAGTVLSSVTQKVDYLIVCDDGSPAWTYRAYGRKVEDAINMRKKGHKITIVHESDLWDAFRDKDVA